MKVVLAGGGTAGHVFPALAVAEILRDRGAEATFVGAARGQEARLVPAAGFPFLPVEVRSAQSRMSPGSVGALVMALRGSRFVRPVVAAADVAVGIGGYASAPAVLAARRTRTPLVLIEQNSVPGAVNRIGARWAWAVATTFAATADRLPSDARVVRTGNPVRPAILAVPERRADLRAEACAAFGLEPGRRTVVVLGGSQGALHLDQAIAEAVAVLIDRRDLQILVATGPAHLDVLRSAATPTGSPGDPSRVLVRAVGFVERMDLALAVADLAVTRAGSGHVAELAVTGLPSILVPYPHATEDHQTSNARELVDAGAAELLPDAALSSERLADAILSVMQDHRRRSSMAAAAAGWAMPDAAVSIADLVEEAAA